MEPRNYESGAAGAPPSAPPSPSTGYPTSGDPQTATPATKPGPHWFYKIGESLRKIITDKGLTPSDSDLTLLARAVELSVPAGSVIAVANTSVPNGFLECDGSAISRAAYPELFAALAVTYGSGDGSTTFNLPDLRGEFVRGLDSGRGVDSGRVLGSSQTAKAGSMTANHSTLLVAAGSGTPIMDSITMNGVIFNDDTSQKTVQMTPGDTRPRNIAMIFCVKY